LLGDMTDKEKVDAPLAGRIMQWPVAPHSLLARRDPFGFHIQARLPGPVNWATVPYFLGLTDETCVRIPSSGAPPGPQGLLDRMVARLIGQAG
jgi:hypothetical protein